MPTAFSMLADLLFGLVVPWAASWLPLPKWGHAAGSCLGTWAISQRLPAQDA